MLRRFLLIVACVLLGGIICLSSQEGEPSVSPPAFPPTIAVIDFANLSDSYVPGIEETAAEILSTLLAQTEKFVVLERERITAVVQELGFVYSGLVDQENTAIEIGKLLGADFVALGSILDYSTDTLVYSGYGLQVKNTVYTMQVSVKLVAVNTGRIVYAEVLEDNEKVLEAGPLRIGLQGVEKRLLTKILRHFVDNVSQLESLDQGQAKLRLVDVVFESVPPGANVEINGIYIGSTPIVYSLEDGKVYQIRITYPGTTPWEMQVRAYEGLVVNVTLAPPTEEEP